ncbi:hypothetical protein SeLEV6574_g07238 [Synchytrium endobioticum]|uniref:Uncharacterized protein n=1 Tax=Synchytrium endobioticum TaxID=286115 RepID=A0A507CD04_9FUNG|nr:hypothetical protein SeLEV6574_g07238 [Synchytrium endobioticum]
MAFFLRDTFDDPFFARSPLDLLVALDAPRRIQSGQGEAASKDGKASGAVAQSEDKGRGLGRFRAPRVDVEETDKESSSSRKYMAREYMRTSITMLPAYPRNTPNSFTRPGLSAVS